MAITVYADEDDVRTAYEGTIPDDEKTNGRLSFLVRQANAKLARKVPSLDRRMAAGEIDPEIPAGMVVEAVLRVWRNPSGATQQGVGPFQLSFNRKAQENEIFFDPDELASLMGDTTVPSSFTVRFPGRLSAEETLLDAAQYPNTRTAYEGI